MSGTTDGARLEMIIAGIGGLADLMETMVEMQRAIREAQDEMFEWLRQPPSSDLSDLLRRVAEAIERNTERLAEQNTKIDALPAAVARAVTHGELAPGS